MQAAELYEQEAKPSEVARRQRVSVKSAYQWHQLWRDGGREALVSRGPSGSRCRLSPRCLEKLAGYLDEGPAAHGWVEDQVWTAARGGHADRQEVPRLPQRLRHHAADAPARLQPAGARAQGRRARRAGRHRVEGGDLGRGKRTRAACGGYICFEDEAGFTRKPPRGRTWGRRGRTPVVTVSGRRSGRLSVAGLIAVRPGSRTRLCHRLRTHRAGSSTPQDGRAGLHRAHRRRPPARRGLGRKPSTSGCPTANPSCGNSSRSCRPNTAPCSSSTSPPPSAPCP